jgi:uncharacterized protein (DUF885 family)
MTEVGSVSEIADRYIDALCALNPMEATYMGVAGHDDRMPDLSPAGLAEEVELTRRTLAELEATTPADDRDRVAIAVMTERLQLSVERYEAGLHHSGLNVIAHDLQGVRGVFDLMPTETVEDWDVIGARLRALPAAIAGMRETLAEGISVGQVPARRQVVECAAQCRRWAGLEGETGFFAGFAADAPSDLSSEAAAADAAYGELGHFLLDVLAPSARTVDAVGREAYALGARVFTGADLDLEETYAWGWEELARISDDAKETAAKVAPGSLREVAAALDADPSRVLIGTEALLAWMQELSDTAVSSLRGVHFDIPEPIRKLTCAVSPPGGSSGAYYTPPSEDFVRPGTMWWSPMPGQERFTSWREVTTVYHEGVPGHHLQCAQVAFNAASLTRYQRVGLFVSGHGEGWALYAERLMDELGWLADPGDRLGFLDAQAFRAARVVLDIGAHLGLPIPHNALGFHPGETWTPELMQELLRTHTLLEEAYIVDEVNRYLGWPGQAISYKVGEKVWLEARADAQRRHGDAFDLKAFHAAALDLGPMGLDPLRAELARI